MPNVTLWFIRETELARLYYRIPPERNPGKEDQVWIPKSIVEHTSKCRDQHIVKLPEWFCEKNNV